MITFKEQEPDWDSALILEKGVCLTLNDKKTLFSYPLLLFL